MKTLQILSGTSVNQAAALLVKEGEASCDFNGITLTSRPGATVEDIVAFYTAESERRAQEYRNSPEGKAAEAERRAVIRKLQASADYLMTRRLPSLDFSNLSQLLGWLADIEDPRDHVGVHVDTEKIIETFISHGYEPDANCYKKFNGEDPENFARWIIGQAIKEPYYPGVRRFAEEWRKKFARETT